MRTEKKKITIIELIMFATSRDLYRSLKSLKKGTKNY
jgi:hypothetical protein